MISSQRAWTPHYAGDRCVVLEFGQAIERHLVDQVVEMNARISAARLEGNLHGIEECVTTFRSLAVIYDPLVVHPDDLLDQLAQLGEQEDTSNTSPAKTLLLPVHYGSDSGPDLADVATMTELDTKAVIDLHQSTEFSVYMLGFLPGFAFLGDTPSALHLPRRSEPRVRVPAGSVAIAMQLTGIYPWDSPGGWHIIGRCPVPLFDGKQDPPTLFTAGDTIKFRAIDSDEYDAIKAQSDSGNFNRDSVLLEQP